MRLSLNVKLISSFLAVVAITGTVATVVGVHSIADRVVSQVQDRVTGDIRSAREIYEESIRDVLNTVRLTATRFFITECFLEADWGRLKLELEKIRQAERLDILSLTDRTGTVVVRARESTVTGDSQAEDEFIREALREKRVVASTQIVPREELMKEGRELVEQAYMKIIPTPRAMVIPKTEETSGMLIKAAAPILDFDGNLIGSLYGGRMLNRDYDLVDKIKNTVYHDEKYEGKDIGTATIFQGDLRISTNVRDRAGQRAIGTKVSQEVYQQVLIQGKPWFARAFVVSDWYITAYEPIRDLSGRIVGMLYVGILEKKYVDMRRNTLWLFLGVTLAGMTIAMVTSYFLARGIGNPVKNLVSATQRLADGNLDQKIESKSKDEIGELGKAFNSMVRSIRERDERLKEQTERQIMKSEKLAMIGRLAAGIAHEINNPLGGILLYSHLVLEQLPPDAAQREALEKIVRETERCTKIVRGLLDFARPSEPKIEMAKVDDVVESVLLLVEKQPLFHNISVEKTFNSDVPPIPFDKSQMQQVFMNIILNAAESMEGEGRLHTEVRSSDDGNYVEAEFTDSGHGIAPEDFEKLFEPFFTTKRHGKGTGLGLSISYGIVKKHGGRIEVESQVGKGSTFSVKLPVKRETTTDEST